MSLTLYNTLSRQSERFEPLEPPRVTMYVCGPTVYNFAHIGNARPAVVFDVLARLLRSRYELTYARNVTDVDDKINAAAAEQGVSIDVITNRYLAAYHADMAALGVRPPDIEPRVTEHMDAIVSMIETLIHKGCAYEADGHVLFEVARFADYGTLSRRSSEELLAGARVEVAPYKRAPEDFVLWKPSAPEIVGWESPWGRGRPGWHIECSAMAGIHLGETIDIHGGGQDLVFPHHENEIAQSACAHDGAVFARFWLHNGFVNMDSEKMAKSLGNVRLVRELVETYPGEVIRMALLSAHYRQPLDWNDRLLEATRQRLDRLYRALLEAGIDEAHGTAGANSKGGTGEHAELLGPFFGALDDDLNTPQALSELAALARAANRCSEPGERRAVATALRHAAGYLGLLSAQPSVWLGADRQADDFAEIEALVRERDRLRGARDFAAADRIRDDLAGRGVVIEDSVDGARWYRAR
ncbi:MAG: cysteine--tRNA ligase [Gammaproteobacteria bacterium]|jgi:cysteinyl-tRNA synthetase